LNKNIGRNIAAAIATCVGLTCFQAQADTTIPIADFFKKATFSGRPLLSPDGNNLAVLIPRKGRYVLAVINLDTRDSKVVASDPDWDIANPSWVNNSRLVFSISKGSNATREENRGGGLFAINKDATGFRKLVPTQKEAEGGNVAYTPYSVLERVGGESNELYVVNNERGRDADLGASDVFRMDTTNGRTKLLTFNNPGKVSGWLLDHSGVIRVASALAADPANKRIKQTVFHRMNEQDSWKPIYEAYADEGKTMSPLAFDFDNKTLLVSGRFNGRDKSAAYIWDFAKNSVGEMVADHPLVDIDDGLMLDFDRKKLIGVAVDAMKPETIFFDSEYAKLQASLNASFPGQMVNFQWRGKRAVVTTRGDNNVGAAYLFDTERKVLEALYIAKPEFEGKKLSPQTIITYSARDGLSIPAYLTLPEGVKPKALPLVAYIHGGPHSRDNFGYDPITQMLASRGYAVLQPQFRMSTGFGWKHHTAGWKQWGLAMQDDVTDGVANLVKQGIVDPKRVCIIGASYGGYATMYGLVKDPDLYQCGVNWVGVTDVKMLFTVAWSDMRGPYMDNLGALMHGDPKTDEAYFQKSSAIENAARIKAPVLMAYGSEDIRVPLIHGEKMRDKLIKQGNTVEWMVMIGEGHGWAKEANNIKFGESVMTFIDKYIGAKTATVKLGELKISQ
jgi:dipeptidyl aminopeptidase/acylaminoacyl peptidase